METFSNFDYHDFKLGFLPMDSQKQLNFNSKNSSVINDYQQQNITFPSSNNLASINSLNFSHHSTASNFPFSNNMLQNSNGSDNNSCSESVMMSPYSVIINSGELTMDDTFFEDENFFFEPLESPAYIYLSPALTSPISQSDQTMCLSDNLTRQPNQNNQKVKRNNSLEQIRIKDSIHHNNNNDPDNNNITNNIIPTIMTGSPSIPPNSSMSLSLPSTNTMVTSSTTAQETMPNLSLGSNLVSEVVSMQSSYTLLPTTTSNNPILSDKIAPITPSSLMKLNESPSSPRSTQNVQKQQQITQSSRLSNEKRNSNKESTFVVPPPPIQSRSIRVTSVDGSQHMIAVSPNTSPVSPGTNSMLMSPMILPSPPPPGKRIVHTNQNSSKSPQALKPTISPNLKPRLSGVTADDAAEQLANKSNYVSILEGTAKSLGISYSSDVHSSLESRRTTHKAAEQKRRDSLKQSFDELKKVIPFNSASNNTNVNNNGCDGNNNNSISGKIGDSNGSMKNVSKLFLLKRAHDHIVELQQQTKEKDLIIQNLMNEIDELRVVKRQKVDQIQQDDGAVASDNK
ncbi:helix-loop-helix DNA-binding domain-containing transcription factor [Gigaspora margarita]|uniref:Helix-loop-helix DNA-binding domain-containing transcription factor n=1 Tax=Gigaspora margarita TaxID=4874 RepID=A0A8H4AQS0_GIGMA|nr:helix-loop-helix DNA-binding domain-containing transcription factor [Gigaspora margarita]